jgi:hypothetical protein
LRRNQSLVLAKNIKLVEGPDGVIPSLVGFECFDRSSLPLGEPLFAFDACQRINHFLVGTKDWKMRVSARILTVARCQDGGKQIKAAAQGIDDGPHPGVEGEWKRHALVGYHRIAAALRIRLFDDVIRVFVPLDESVLDEWDLGYGPVNGSLSV